jgi:UDP-N-acetylmuramoylalanine--D-glutamate ligase
VEKDREFSVVGRRVVVMGAARSGIAAAELLARRGASVVLSETRESFEGADRLRAAGVTLELGGHTAGTLAAADLIVTSPGVPPDQPVFAAAKARGIESIGELELAWRWTKGRVIAITGTKGKSTTTTLIGRMLSAAGRTALVGGNIGVPLSAQVEQSSAETVHVVETSSFQLETTSSFRPWIAVWLNLADDHLDRHPDVASYAAAKARIFANQTADEWAVVNADDPMVWRHSDSTRARRVAFSLTGAVDRGLVVEGDWIAERSDTGVKPLFPVSAVELTGRHMLHNVLAATAAASIAGVNPPAMVDALRGFHGLEHVMEPAGEFEGVRFVNDSKATNVEAALRSIESFDGGVVAIVGGKFKGGDLRDLAGPLKAHGRAVVAIGEARPLVSEALSPTLPVVEAASLGDAVARACSLARPDGVVLLAPACASFDMFADYADRGRQFKEAVQRLAQGAKAEGEQ